MEYAAIALSAIAFIASFIAALLSVFNIQNNAAYEARIFDLERKLSITDTTIARLLHQGEDDGK